MCIAETALPLPNWQDATSSKSWARAGLRLASSVCLTILNKTIPAASLLLENPKFIIK